MLRLIHEFPDFRLRTDDGSVSAYVAFSATTAWLKAHIRMEHRILGVDEYAVKLCNMSPKDLEAHAKLRKLDVPSWQDDFTKEECKAWRKRLILLFCAKIVKPELLHNILAKTPWPYLEDHVFAEDASEPPEDINTDPGPGNGATGENHDEPNGSESPESDDPSEDPPTESDEDDFEELGDPDALREALAADNYQAVKKELKRIDPNYQGPWEKQTLFEQAELLLMVIEDEDGDFE